MKAYLLDNSVVLTDGKTAKIYEGTNGFYDGIDLYAEDAKEKLEAYFSGIEAKGEMESYKDIHCEHGEVGFEEIESELENAALLFDGGPEEYELSDTKTFYEVMEGSLEIHSLLSPRKQPVADFINENIAPSASAHAEDDRSEFQKRFDNLEDALKEAASHKPSLECINSGVYHYEEFYVSEMVYDLDDENEPVWDEGFERGVHTTFDCFYGYDAEMSKDRLIVFQPDMESVLDACTLNHQKQKNEVTGIGYHPESNKIIAINYDKDGRNPVEDMKYVISLGSYGKDEMIPYDILKNAFQNNAELKERFQNCLEQKTISNIQLYNDGLTDHNPAIFSRKNLQNMDFTGLDLSHALFIGADLRWADFEESNLMNACFRNADLRGASFMDCNLSRADFTNCDLRDAVLRGADLSHAKLTNARLEGADLEGVTIVDAEIGQTLLEKVSLDKMKKNLDAKEEQPVSDKKQKEKDMVM